MVTIKCDSCGAIKPASGVKPYGDWILGYDLEIESPWRLQRSVRFLDKWDDRRVLELGAIHFCSEACKEEYIALSRAA
jgi:hypothetical protein